MGRARSGEGVDARQIVELQPEVIAAMAVKSDEHARLAARDIDLILKGTKPSDIPFQLPIRHELSINVTVTKALGLTIPPSLLARADEVIE